MTTIFGMGDVRQVVVMISPLMLADMTHVGWRIPNDRQHGVKCIEGLPVDAEYKRGFYDAERDLFGMVFEHESFALVQHGMTLPVVRVAFESWCKASGEA